MKKQTNTLAIDTSSNRLQLALIKGNKTTSYVEDVARGHAEIIFDRIERFFASNEITYDDLVRIIVITGPGSFTGLRASIAATRAIGFAKKIPIIGVPTLLALSLGIKHKENFTIILDARRNEIYCQGFSKAAYPIGKEQLLSNEHAPSGDNIFMPEHIDIELLAHFGASALPEDFIAIPNYVRQADAKPQIKHIVELEEKSASS